MTNFQNKIPAVQSGREIESSCFLRTFLGIDMTHSPIKRTGDVRGGEREKSIQGEFALWTTHSPRPLVADGSRDHGRVHSKLRTDVPNDRTKNEKQKGPLLCMQTTAGSRNGFPFDGTHRRSDKFEMAGWVTSTYVGFRPERSSVRVGEGEGEGGEGKGEKSRRGSTKPA